MHELVLAVLFLSAVIVSSLVRKLRLPRVLSFSLVGAGVGAALSSMGFPVPEMVSRFLSVALSALAFHLGTDISVKSFLSRWRKLLLAFAIEATVVTAAVAATTTLFGEGTLSVMWGLLAVVSAPAAIGALMREFGVKGPVSEACIEYLVVEDILGVVAFVTALSFFSPGNPWKVVLKEVLVAPAAGILIGWLICRISRRLTIKEIGVLLVAVFLLASFLSKWLKLSELLIGMFAGVYVANFSPRFERVTEAYREIEAPFLVAFFVLSSALFNPAIAVRHLPLLAAYTGVRFASKVCGGLFAGRVLGLSANGGAAFGFSLLPHTGVSIGLAFSVFEVLPGAGLRMISVVLPSAILFGVLSPPLVRKAFEAIGELGAGVQERVVSKVEILKQEAARLRLLSRKRERQMRVLKEIAAAIGEMFVDERAFLGHLLVAARSLVPFDYGIIWERRGTGISAVVVYGTGDLPNAGMDLERSPAGLCARTGEVLEFRARKGTLPAKDATYSCCLPLRHGGEVFGVLEVLLKAGKVDGPSRELLKTLGELGGTVLWDMRRERALRRRSKCVDAVLRLLIAGARGRSEVLRVLLDVLRDFGVEGVELKLAGINYTVGERREGSFGLALSFGKIGEARVWGERAQIEENSKPIAAVSGVGLVVISLLDSRRQR